LRPATVEDAERLFAWRTDPLTQEMSLTAGPQTLTEHAKWLDIALADPHVHLYVAEVDGTPVGTGRFDIENKSATVSLTVAPEHRGKGHATAILQELNREMRRRGVIQAFARVRGHNVPSLRAFLSNGYEPTTPIIRLVFRG
jgi:RimJ/RimL family protein N-acetyltransferase